ncbi:MAG: hypothetical protein EBY04_02815, partial [Actinobacteria bacterium]|nr:hypothetical protein [Actinomycetota bacterium]
MGLGRLIVFWDDNRITIDGDTSTNDSFVVIASGKAGHPEITDWHTDSARLLKQA